MKIGDKVKLLAKRRPLKNKEGIIMEVKQLKKATVYLVKLSTMKIWLSENVLTAKP